MRSLSRKGDRKPADPDANANANGTAGTSPLQTVASSLESRFECLMCNGYYYYYIFPFSWLSSFFFSSFFGLRLLFA
jgi:hypothetical protein